jgi:4-deoxy-L-threo-5-hexosulose-uronate ketol-isomerase
MEIRHGVHPEHGKTFDTEKLRKEFLIKDLFVDNELKLVYSHIDRIIVGGAVPKSEITLQADKKTIGTDYLLERRELGILNLGETGSVAVDGKFYELGKLEALYVGKGSRQVAFTSKDPESPAKFYLVCGQAHKEFSTRLIRSADAKQVHLGSDEECNKRTIFQVIHPDVLPSCNVVMGYTRLEPGSVWNTMPCHTHERRMEVYLYFDVPENAVVFHLMGEPAETRHIVVRSDEVVISPSWSIHSGVGTKNYSFVWGMVGENQTFTDMDGVSMKDLL